MNKLFTYTFLFFAWMVLAVPAGAQTPAPIRLDATQIQALGLETTPVQNADRLAGQTLPAKVRVPNASLRVVSVQLEGTVESLLVAEGEQVSQGQPLALIRSSQLLERQAAFLEARTRRVLAAQSLERDRKLYAEGIIAERRLLETQATYRELRNAEQRDRQALQLAGMSAAAIDELASTQKLNAVMTVRSPQHGVVLEQLATAGQRLSAGDPLYRIGDLSTLWVEVHVPLDKLGKVAPGDRVELPEQGIQGEVISVGRMVHTADQGVLVRAAVKAGAERLRPGQFVPARLTLDTSGRVFRLPAAAVVHNAGEDYVFVEQPDGFVPTAIQVLAHDGKEVIVRVELPEGARVVSRGTAALKAVWLEAAQ